MRVLIHLSDMHFGRIAPEVVEPLIDAVWAARPHVVVVSGDFVQHGTRAEFLAAGSFLRRLPEPRITVPGNHDLPFRNIFRRFKVGLDLYREHINPELEPFFLDQEIAILGINTARSRLLRGGSISKQQIPRRRTTPVRA